HSTTIAAESRMPHRPAITITAKVCSVIGTGYIGMSAQDDTVIRPTPAARQAIHSGAGMRKNGAVTWSPQEVAAPGCRSGRKAASLQAMRRKHLLRRAVWILSTGAGVLALVLVVLAVTALNGGFAAAH